MPRFDLRELQEWTRKFQQMAILPVILQPIHEYVRNAMQMRVPCGLLNAKATVHLTRAWLAKVEPHTHSSGCRRC